MIPAIDLATILLMALATYGTRAGGYLLLRNRTLGLRARAVMAAAPGCVLITVIAPHFVSPRLAGPDRSRGDGRGCGPPADAGDGRGRRAVGRGAASRSGLAALVPSRSR